MRIPPRPPDPATLAGWRQHTVLAHVAALLDAAAAKPGTKIQDRVSMGSMLTRTSRRSLDVEGKPRA